MTLAACVYVSAARGNFQAGAAAVAVAGVNRAAVLVDDALRNRQAKPVPRASGRLDRQRVEMAGA